MSVLISIGKIAYILLFFAAVIFSLTFQFGKESDEERGKTILNKSYGFAFPLVIFGWFIVSITDDFITPLSLRGFQTAIWFVVTGTYIVHAATLLGLKKTS